ncbi:MAG: MerR family transcriptional regulator [Clostridiales bacterium]|nr:MerR family transcriptional regulator [Clostridiales bacterium]
MKKKAYMEESSLLSIKELAKVTGITQSTLRYYDEIGLLSPTLRGDNNYRYYHPHQIVLLNFINVLADMGVSLAKIKELKTDRTPSSILEVLRRQEVELNRQLREIQGAYTIIHTFRDNIQTGLLARDGEISVQDLPELPIILGQDNDFRNRESWYSAFMDFYKSAQQYRINLRYPIGGMHESMNDWLREPGWPKKYFSMDPVGNSVRAAGKYLVSYHRDYYGQFGDIPERMEGFARENGLQFEGPVYNIYLHDEICTVDPNQYLVQITARLKDSKRTARRD